MPNKRVAIGIRLDQPWAHHFDVFAGIERYALEHGNWDWTVEPFLRLVRRARGRANYDGVIARATPELASQAAALGVPLVNVQYGSLAAKLPSVLPNHRTCGRMAAEHLLHRGYRQFAFQGASRHLGSRQAWAGFKDALRAAKCPWTVHWYKLGSDERPQAWHRYLAGLERWIPTWRPPVGLVTMMANRCRYVANACLHAGLRIPEDVGLICLGDEPLICARPEPSLSSIVLGHDRAGYEAAALLDRMMAGEAAPETPVLIEPTELIIRRSTDSFVVDDPLVRQALTFIAEHSHEDIRARDAAGHAHATGLTLQRHFRAALGRTVTEEITRLRLDRAKRLLVDSDKEIKEVAHDCGFTDAAYFVRVFVRVEGMPPGEYRRRKR